MSVSFPTNAEAFEFLARYLLSGFLIFLVRNAFVVGERPKIADIIMDIALFSLINQLVWRLLAYLGEGVRTTILRVSTSPSAFEGIGLSQDMALFLEVLVLPVALGVITGKMLVGGWLRGPYRALSIPITDPLPRAYDHVFYRRGTGFVILTFKGGERIYGYYGPRSRAGRDPGRSEIYLERLYAVGGDGQWSELTPTRSALVYLQDIRAIEFLETETGD